MNAERTVEFGLTLSSEEHAPAKLVKIARAAEEAGFDFVSISDHYHPWIGAQGHSPFVWSVLGAIAASTDELGVGVGVTCPTTRIHPAVVAQAVATTACLLEGRFTWGVGTGEALNEHILGDRWPPAPIRLEMLAEALDVIRQLLAGGSVSHYGRHYTVENARLFDLPRSTPPILMSAFGPRAARQAAATADGLWITGVSAPTISRWRDAGGTGPVWSQITLSWDRSEADAVERARTVWPNSTVPGQLTQDLPSVQHFELAATAVTPDQIASSIPCGPDLDPVLAQVRDAIDAGVDHLYFHQVGDPTDGFIDVWRHELQPELKGLVPAGRP